jgi:hypothetical protein
MGNKWSHLEKRQKDKATERSKYGETDEIQREAGFEREGLVKIERAGDIDFEAIKPKKRQETVETADLEAEGDAFGFGERAEDDEVEPIPGKAARVTGLWSWGTDRGRRGPGSVFGCGPPVKLKGSVVGAEAAAIADRLKLATPTQIARQREERRLEFQLSKAQQAEKKRLLQELKVDKRKRKFEEFGRLEIAGKPLGHKFPRMPKVLNLGFFKNRKLVKEKANATFHGLLPKDFESVKKFFEEKGARIVIRWPKLHRVAIDVIWNEKQPMRNKIGRPRLGDAPLTNAEKQRRKRAKRKGEM